MQLAPAQLARPRKTDDGVAGGRSRSWNGCSCEVYSGRLRQQLLDAAIARGDAVSVVAFFNGFLREAAGQHGQGPAWPRQATTGKPVYSRAQILEPAVLRRKGAISEADWAAWEHELVAAGREGRIADALPLDADNGRSRWISAPSAPPGNPESPTQTRGWQGGGIANGGRFRRRRLPKFLNENNTPLAVTNGGMDRTGRR